QAALALRGSSGAALRCHLEMVGIRVIPDGVLLYSYWGDASCPPLCAASLRPAEGVIHAFHGKGIPSHCDCRRVFAPRGGAEDAAGRKQVCRLGFAVIG